MIARKEKFLSIEKNHVSTSVPWSWDGKNVVVQLDRLFALDDSFNPKSARAISSMHNSRAIKSLSKQFMIRDIVFVTQQHLTYNTHRIEALD